MTCANEDTYLGMAEKVAEVEDVSDMKAHEELMTRIPVSETALLAVARDLNLVAEQQSKLDGDERQR